MRYKITRDYDLEIPSIKLHRIITAEYSYVHIVLLFSYLYTLYINYYFFKIAPVYISC